MTRKPQSEPTKVLIVEDHILVSETLMLWLEESAEFKVEGSARSINDAIRELETKDFNIVLLDLGLCDEDALHHIDDWKEAFPDIQILVLSASRNDLIAQRALENGAIGFVSKSDSSEDLIRGLESARAGIHFLSKSVSPFLERERSACLPQLTRREEQILRELASGQPNREIALRLGIRTKTIERHRENIKHKLGLSTASELVREAVRLFPSQGR